jgi:hypothetical protein
MMLQILNPIPSFIILIYLRCSIRGREVRRAAGKSEKREGEGGEDNTQTKTRK